MHFCRLWVNICLVAGTVFGLSLETLAVTTIIENFDRDPFWASLNASAVNDDYGYTHSTDTAGGSLGEAGGKFGRHDAFDSYYADTDLGGTLLAGSDLLHSSGKISIDSSQGGGGNNFSIAFFDQTNPSKGGNALRINVVQGGGVQLWLRLEIGKNLISPISTGLVDGDYLWNMNWDPTGSPDSLGEGTVTFTGVSPGTPASVTTVLDIPPRNEPGNPEWLQETLPFNAFGLHNYDGEATTSNFMNVFVDDVSYTVVAAPATTSAWGKSGSDVWTNSLNWSPGEVPFGNDRTAVFGTGVSQNTTVFSEVDLTIKRVEFNNGIFDYAVAGTGGVSLTVEANTGNASIEVFSGDHQFQIPVILASNTDVDAAPGSTLSFNNSVDLSGFTLNANGNVAFNNQLILGGGSVTLVAGSSSLALSGQGDSLDGTLLVTLDESVASGDTFDLLQFDTLDDTFDLVVVPELEGGLYWDDSSLYVDGTITVVPEPRSILLLILAGVMMSMLHQKRLLICIPRRTIRVLVSMAALVTMACLASSSPAELIGQHFNFDPSWGGDDNVLPQGSPTKERDDFNNYRYRPDTSNALGSSGEIGGYFGMNTFDSYYADTTLGGNVGGSFPLQQSLHASGKLMVNSDHGPTWNINIGFFDQTDYTDANPSVGDGFESGSGDAIRFAIIEQSPDFRIRLEIRQQGNGYNGPVLNGPAGLLDGQYTWTMDYDPSGGASPGFGRFSLEMVGANTISTFVDVDSNGKNIAMNLNAFGFTNYNSGVSRPDFNKHYTFLDDLTYTTNEVADPVVSWAGPGSGSWNTAYSWQRTASSDGGGFVPDGSDRTAILGGGIAHNSVVFVDSDVTVGELRFENATHRYSIAGLGRVKLNGGALSNAKLNVVQGQHEILSTLMLEDTTVLTTNAGTKLDLHGKLDLNNNLLIKSGNGELSINSQLSGTSGTLNLNAGTLSGIGQIGGNLTAAGGTMSPGNSAGILTVANDYLQQASSLLSVELGGLVPGTDYDVLDVGSIATLVDGSVIDLTLINGFLPEVGDIFDILTASSVLVDVATLNVTGVADMFPSVVDTPGGKALRLTFISGNADFDGDLDVDGEDFLIWQRGLEMGGQTDNSNGDASGNGTVGAEDLLVWEQQYGTIGTPLSSALGVPEPTSCGLVTLAMVLLACRLCPRRSKVHS